MTDKEIIINGVDVSKCEYRDWRNFCCCNNSKENEGEERVTGRGGCKYNPNCHYKQLARKEQECEELKETLIEIKDIAKNMNKECFYDDFDCEDCDMKNGCTYQGKIKILQKISEVENE